MGECITIIGSITKITRGEHKINLFKVKDFNSEITYSCKYEGFLPIQLKDNVKGVAHEISAIYEFVETPFVAIAKHEDILYDIFFRALANKKLHHSKVKEIISNLLIKYENIDAIYKYFNELSCQEIKEDFSDGIMKEIQLTSFLRWWKRNIVNRQLYLWQMTNTEINGSKIDIHLLADKVYKNAFTIQSLKLDKAVQLEKLFGREPNEKEIKEGKIYRMIESKSIMPLSVLLKLFPELPVYKKNLADKYGVVFEEKMVYSKYEYEMELFLSESISNHIINERENMIRNKSVKWKKEIEGNIILTSEQNDALDTILNSHISIVTGGAGCGKTTLINQLIHNLYIRGEQFIITSFTGKAVMRIKEVVPKHCQNKCFTMSRLIHKQKTKQPLDHFDHLIIDEASMISNDLLYQFHTYFTHYFKIYLFGDCNQLQPVGGGDLLYQLIKSEEVSVRYLNINKRLDGEESNNILAIANELINKERDLEQDFNFVNGQGFNLLEGDEKIVQCIIKALFKKGIPDDKITILTPFNKYINQLIKYHQMYYLGSDCYNYRGTRYFIGDRVMQNKNVYTENIEIMNGDEGVIKKIDDNGITVEYDKEKEIFYQWSNEIEKETPEDEETYEMNINTSQLRHSFCKTIHKSQGSEYEYIIIYLPTIFNDMMNINLLYTAITRAKKSVWLVGDINNLRKVCKRRINDSYSKLAVRIKEKCQIANV